MLTLCLIAEVFTEYIQIIKDISLFLHDTDKIVRVYKILKINLTVKQLNFLVAGLKEGNQLDVEHGFRNLFVFCRTKQESCS